MPLEIPQSLRREWAIIHRGTAEVLPEEELLAKLIVAREQGRPLRVKYGADPSAPDLHLGHMVPIGKLRELQDLGHQIVFIIGDFTAQIGDPSGQSATRPQLSPEQVAENAKTYLDQIYRVLDREKTEVVYNSAWLGKLTARDTIGLAAKYTVARMLERDDFHKRFAEERPIFIHELLYPLYQGYDSIVVRADIEAGGTDQKFNFVVARELQRAWGQEPQIVLTTPLLVGLDGVKKMSKSLGNYIGITEPPREMFGKTMSLADSVMLDYFALVLQYDEGQVAELRAALESGALHPREAKARLAREIVARFYDAAAADAAAAEFDRVFRERQAPEELPTMRLRSETGAALPILDVLLAAGLAESRREAKRLIAAGGVDLDGLRCDHLRTTVEPGEHLLKVGKHRFCKVVVTTD
ncbi:MAG: tyrosine--tRNA ligase [Candidatus Sumerlaeia bacterium]|nr:tyrosine--tRNA ligase [Candidatus Sumerlaeia bacterium]